MAQFSQQFDADARQWCLGLRVRWGKEYGDRLAEFMKDLRYPCPCTRGKLCMVRPAPTQDADVVEQSPYARRDICVLRGARPPRDQEGRIVAWAGPTTREVDPHEHETLVRR